MPPAENKRRDIAPSTEASEQTLGVPEFATLVGVNPRTARRAVEAAISGKSWRGQKLIVSVDDANGGGGGGKRYLIHVQSLDAKWQTRWRSQRAEVAARKRIPILTEGAPNDAAFVTEAPRAPWDRAQREAAHEHFARLPAALQTRAEAKLPVVQLYFDLVDQGAPKRKAAELTSDKTGVAARTVRFWADKCVGHDAGDWRCLLADALRGHAERVDLPLYARLWMNRELLTENELHVKSVWRRYKREAASQRWPVLSYETFLRRFREIPQNVRKLGRKGKTALADGYFKLERSYSALCVHEGWSVDGRKLDVVMVDDAGKPYRPIIVVFLDLRSRIVCGYAIGKTESAELVQAAYLDAIQRTKHLPHFIQADNGMGFNAKKLTGGAPSRNRFAVRDDELIGLWSIQGVAFRPVLPRRGRSKPVESFHRITAELDRRCGKAYCGNAPGAAPEQFDPAHAITVADYRKLLEETLAIYHDEPHRGDSMYGRSPNAVYNDLLGCGEKKPRQPTAQNIREARLSWQNVRLSASDHSIRLRGNRYYHDRLAELDRGKLYAVQYDPNDLSQPISVYDGRVYLCDAPIKERTGYLSDAAAKEVERSRRAYVKATQEQLAAFKGMHKPKGWLRTVPAPQNTEPPAAAVREASKVAALVIPKRGGHPQGPAAADAPTISNDEAMSLILKGYARPGKR